MTADTRSGDTKRRTLIEAALSAAPALDRAQATAITDAFAALTAPQEPDAVIGYITILSSSSSGQSRKPGNVVLNWRKLFELLPDSSLAAIGAATATATVQPWAVPLAALYIWTKVWRASEETLTDVEASVIQALSMNRGSDDRIDEAGGLENTNRHRQSHGRDPLSSTSYSRALTRLAKIDCIELEDGRIWLRESVRIKYT